MRRLRIAPPVQLELVVQSRAQGRPEVWGDLPEVAQVRVVALLARMIARGVVSDGGSGEEEVS